MGDVISVVIIMAALIITAQVFGPVGRLIISIALLVIAGLSLMA